MKATNYIILLGFIFIGWQFTREVKKVNERDSRIHVMQGDSIIQEMMLRDCDARYQINKMNWERRDSSREQFYKGGKYERK